VAVLIGRGREIAQLREFVAACEDGLSALTIEGEAGIGKTALFDAAISDAIGLRVLRVRCVDAESRLAYAGLADLLGERVSTAAAALPPPQRRALEIALLRAGSAGEHVEPHAVGRGVLGVLRLLAVQAPLLLAIDDAQWLDAASARALAFALRRLDGIRLGLLATSRATDGRPPLGLDEVMSPARWHRLVLGPLRPDDLGELLDQRFPRPARRSLRSRVITVAAGNPLYATELMAAHLMSETSVDNSLKLPPRLEELLAGRLERLPQRAAEPLAAVASLAAPTVALVVAALGADANVGLAYALDENVLQVSEGRLRFSHPLLAVASLNRLAPSVRRALHGRLAVSVADDEERGRHLVLSADGPDAETAAGAERAADLARARGAPEAAGLLAEAAIRLTPPGRAADLIRRRVAAGYHWVTAGEVSRGRAHMAAAMDAAPHGPARAELQWRLGMLAHLDGDLGQAIRLLETARTEAGEDHGLAVEATRRLAGLYGLQGRMDDSVRCWRLALDAARVAGDQRAELETLSYGHSAVLVGAATAAELRDRVERLAGVAGSFAPHEDPEAFLAWLHMLMGQPADAAGPLERLYQRAAEQGEEMGQVVVAALLAEAELAAGNWERARQLAGAARNAGRQADVNRSFGSDLYIASLVEAHLGHLDHARAAATALVELAEHRGLIPLLWQGRAVLGFVSLCSGDPQGAHTYFSVVIDSLRQLGVREWGLVHLVWSDLDALVELGEIGQAAVLAEDMRSRALSMGRRLELATAERGRGLVLAAQGDFAAAHAALRQSLAQHEQLDWPFERARTLMSLGLVLRRSKQRRAARDTLHQALAVFDQLGARLWSAKTTSELARIGGRVSAGDSLTASERRVACLVAEGRSNRQVADKLFLSVKTVAAHLTSVYAKLGVRSRAELARQLRDNQPPPGGR